MEWRSHSSRWWIVQPETGHAPDWYSVLLLTARSPTYQGVPAGRPERTTRSSHQRLPGCAGMHPSISAPKVSRSSRSRASIPPCEFRFRRSCREARRRSHRIARRSGATATVRTSRDAGCCRRSFANRPNGAPPKPPECQSGKTLYQTNGHDPHGCSRTPGVMMYRTRGRSVPARVAR